MNPLDFSKKIVIDNIRIDIVTDVWIGYLHELERILDEEEDVEYQFNCFYKETDSDLRKTFDKNFSRFMNHLKEDNIYNKYFKICTRYPYDHCGLINNICKPTKEYIRYMKQTKELNIFFQNNRQHVGNKNMYHSFFIKLKDYLEMLMKLFQDTYGSYVTTIDKNEYIFNFSVYCGYVGIINIKRIYKFHIDYFKQKQFFRNCIQSLFILNKMDQLPTQVNRFIVETFI